MSTHVERLKKLQALAMRGVGGEREQARVILEKLTKKYGVAVDDLDETEQKKFDFTYHGKVQYKLLCQIACKVINDDPTIYKLTYNRSGRTCRTQCRILCTEAQKTEIEFLFDFYTTLWEKEVEYLLGAYIQKHELFRDLKKGEQGMDVSPEDLKKLHSMMRGLSDETPLLRITDGKAAQA